MRRAERHGNEGKKRGDPENELTEHRPGRHVKRDSGGVGPSQRSAAAQSRITTRAVSIASSRWSSCTRGTVSKKFRHSGSIRKMSGGTMASAISGNVL